MTRAADRLDRLLGARLPGPPDGLRRGPFRRDAFPSPLHSERRAANTGVWLGAAFLVCFLTGVLSDQIQDPQGWFTWPASPVWAYQVTQGVHVAAGLAAIPLLLVKLWTVHPLLFEWPPAGSPARAVSRLSVLVLVGAGVFELATGLVNIAQWYPFGFFFPTAHYWTGWIAIGAISVHVGAKAAEIRRGLARAGSPGRTAGLAPDAAVEVRERDAAAEEHAVSRRALVLATGLGVSAVTLTTVGQTLRPLGPVAVLAPRLPTVGPQGVPVNQTAENAGVLETARADDYRLVVAGPQRLELSPADLRALPQATERLPIACVEGWSASGDWTGVRLRELLRLAGLPAGTAVRVLSLQPGGRYDSSVVDVPQAADPRTLLALRLNGEPLSLDHGFPVRLIAPNRPGVMQTKWLRQVEPA
ncbi:molybdopterin-dependent oxidoreductase [Geodermatophilus sp. YIM 151500]|uniref:molybdopterin-dependent oxidoreductase n=1 Tax=Geodermatophilus sp. YIM 151500 TaxID=2984531 RepID=UPI0021E43B4A|nr:molybdopterin-dependent oxidoreductase [Geodermatophilus sp. YIM 151500]MCV2489376.1 molybdopterin-dependent oxidoreductase [Geodermatophilus sp. YIM 151500]